MGCSPSKYSSMSNDLYYNNLYSERNLYDLLFEIYRRKSFDQNVIVNDSYISKLLDVKVENKNFLLAYYLFFRLYDIKHNLYKEIVDKMLQLDLNFELCNSEDLYLVSFLDITTNQRYIGFCNPELYEIIQKSSKFLVRFYFFINKSKPFIHYIREFQIILNSKKENIENIDYLIYKINKKKLYCNFNTSVKNEKLTVKINK
jgi:hypothetical protein